MCRRSILIPIGLAQGQRLRDNPESAGGRGQARERALRNPLLGDDIAPIEHHREQRAHPLDTIDRSPAARDRNCPW